MIYDFGNLQFLQRCQFPASEVYPVVGINTVYRKTVLPKGKHIQGAPSL